MRARLTLPQLWRRRRKLRQMRRKMRRHRQQRPLQIPPPTTTSTPAARAPLAVPLQDAGAGTNLDLGITIESDGTPDFNGDDTAGNDSGANNGIVRVNDTVTYRVQFSVNGTVGTNTTFRMTLPKGMEMTAVPGFCQAGSTLTPPRPANQPCRSAPIP